LGVTASWPGMAQADQNSGYSTTPSASPSADYFDPHDQGFGEFGYEVAPTTAGQPAELASIACPAGKLCTYKDTFWWGDMYYYSVPVVPQPLCTPIGPPYNNNIGSARNYTNHAVKFHDNGTCGNGNGYTTTYVLNPGQSADWGFTIWDNRWSSIQWL
jgi:hypothetical protein